MNTSTFYSILHPQMNIFLQRLEVALEQMPNNPKPQCKGFYLTFFNKETNYLTTEKIGIVPTEKNDKYFRFSLKKVLQTMEKGETLSRNFENDKLEQYPGAVNFQLGCTGISGHESMVDEAGSALWPIAFNLQQNYGNDFFQNMKKSEPIFMSFVESVSRSVTIDNPWVMTLGGLIAKQ